METSIYTRMTVELHGDEIETLRQVVRLAHERLAASPRHQLKGSPLERQAGLTGVELFRVDQMIAKLAASLGLELKAPAPAPKPADEPLALLMLTYVLAGGKKS